MRVQAGTGNRALTHLSRGQKHRRHLLAGLFELLRHRVRVLIDELPPRADQRAFLVAVRETRIAEGWQADEIGPRCSHFFARRAGERVIVGIERDPMRQIRR